MQIIDDGAALARALASPLAPALRRLVTERLDQLLADTGGEYDWPELVRFLVVEPIDTAEAIETAAGYPVITSPAWEWVIDHGGILEGAVVLSNSGFGLVVLLAIAEGVCAELLSSMLEQAAATPACLAQGTNHEQFPAP